VLVEIRDWPELHRDSRPQFDILCQALHVENDAYELSSASCLSIHQQFDVSVFSLLNMSMLGGISSVQVRYDDPHYSTASAPSQDAIIHDLHTSIASEPPEDPISASDDRVSSISEHRVSSISGDRISMPSDRVSSTEDRVSVISNNEILGDEHGHVTAATRILQIGSCISLHLLQFVNHG
jgi:hypothetical protein